jgi:ATP-dependent helicase/DNAse subunit B
VEKIMVKKIPLSEIELKVRYHKPPELNYAYQKAISYSQFSVYATCPHQWYNSYVLNLNPYSNSIHTLFGTAMHETLQNYLTVMFDQSAVYADSTINLEEWFQNKFIELYQAHYDKTGEHVSSAVEMREFYEDGKAILEWFRKKRRNYFSSRGCKLVGIELPLLVNVSNNIFLKGFIDIVIYDTDLDKLYIYDIKTSSRGWSDKEKKDELKIAQILLYKEFFAKQYNFDVEKIEVEFFIVKRKIFKTDDFIIPRIQQFKPASGKGKRRKAVDKLELFAKDCFDSLGKPIEKLYIKNVGEKSCKWCPYNDTIHCDKIASS